MATQLTNRLVGTVALLAVGIIVLPDLLDGEKQRHVDDFAVIPLKPEVDMESHRQVLDEVESLPQQVDKGVEILASNQPAVTETNAADLASADDQEIASESVTSAPAMEGFKQSAWAIQLGGFKNAANVNELLKKLTDAGYTVYTHPKKPKDGVITRVYVGPSLDKQSLENKINNLKKLTGLKGRVTAYNPLQQ